MEILPESPPHVIALNSCNAVEVQIASSSAEIQHEPSRIRERQYRSLFSLAT
jgi:tRNA A37 threonylcarbamoyladenosine synthetase subunit TsaC/SUA5/YrdC